MSTASAGLLLAIASVWIGCGGKRAGTTPAGGDPAAAREGGGGDAMVPPEKMDEVTRSLERKRSVVSRCLAAAIDNQELPRNSSGKVTLEIVISPAGKAESVKIVRASLTSRLLDACIVDRVKEIQFPELPRTYETSYTYGFEAA